MKEHEKIILRKIKNYAIQILDFKGNLTFEDFTKDYKTTSACVFNLSQIGELAGKLSEDFIENSTIPWRKIRGMRNRIVHDYDGVKLNIVWDVLVDFIPTLIEDIEKILNGAKK